LLDGSSEYGDDCWLISRGPARSGSSTAGQEMPRRSTMVVTAHESVSARGDELLPDRAALDRATLVIVASATRHGADCDPDADELVAADPLPGRDRRIVVLLREPPAGVLASGAAGGAAPGADLPRSRRWRPLGARWPDDHRLDARRGPAVP